MKVDEVEIEQFRAFERVRVPLGQLTVLIGANNAGKSSILRALHLIQGNSGIRYAHDLRAKLANVTLTLSGMQPGGHWGKAGAHGAGRLIIHLKREGQVSQYQLVDARDGLHGVAPFPSTEPNHFVVPFLSKRKAVTYSEDVRLAHANNVSSDMQFLAAKLARLSNPAFPGSSDYHEACQDILGFTVTAISSDGGMVPGIYLSDGRSFHLDQLGEGVSQVAALLAILATSKGKLFLIEEPENDLHPTALKALLKLIVKSAAYNQFVVSTHSNIVLSYLGGQPDAVVVKVVSEKGQLPPVAKAEVVGESPADRLEVLRELGYTLNDFELWDGWLLLEESSAERIIREFIGPWFVPKLARVRTVSANGAGNVPKMFREFHRLMVFLHLAPMYQRRVWVRVDGDSAGQEVVGKLKTEFPSWSETIAPFNTPHFESYYPAHFAARVREVLEIRAENARKVAKKVLLEDVLLWLRENEQRGREALAVSAGPVIEDLKALVADL